MKVSFWLNGRNGQVVRIHMLSTDCVCCPVCGGAMDCTGYDLKTFLFLSTTECPNCRTILGHHDVPDLREMQGKYDQLEVWSKLRKEWLDKHNWKKALVDRIRARLEIEV